MDNRIAIVQIDGEDTYCDVSRQLCENLLHEGFTPVIVDTRRFSVVSESFVRFRRPFRSTRSICPYSAAANFSSYQSDLLKKRLSPSWSSLPLQVGKEIELSIWSEIHTVFEAETISFLDPVALFWRFRSRRLASSAYLFFSKMISQLGPELVVVANGRFPHQVALKLAARQLDVEVKFYERGFAESGFFFQGFQTQDRVEFQNHAARIGKTVSSIEAKGLADDWLRKRQTPINPYFRDDAMPDVHIENLSVVIFPSSPDEYFTLVDWSRRGFSNQFVAFQAWLEENLATIETVVFRIHPNSLRKPVRSAIGELKESWKIRVFLRSKGIGARILSGASKANSYLLANKANHVLVSASTMGLEAAIMQKKVWCVWDAAYDNCLEVTRWPRNMSAELPLVSKPTAREWVAGAIGMDVPLHSHACHSGSPVSQGEAPKGPENYHANASKRLATKLRLFLTVRTLRGIIEFNPMALVLIRISLRKLQNTLLSRIFDFLEARSANGHRGFISQSS